MEKIVFLDRDSIRANFRTPDFPHEWRDFSMTGETEIVERLRDATIAVTNKVPLRRATLEQLAGFKNDRRRRDRNGLRRC